MCLKFFLRFDVSHFEETFLPVFHGPSVRLPCLKFCFEVNEQDIEDEEEVEDDLGDDDEDDGPADAQAGREIGDLVGQAEKEAGYGQDAKFVEDLLVVGETGAIGLEKEEIGQLEDTVEKV